MQADIRGKTMEKSTRILKIVSGFTLVGVGVPMLALPVPSVPVILLGLALLAAEYVWARRLLDQAKALTARMRALLPALK